MKAPTEEIYGKSMQRKVYSVVCNAVADNRGSIFIRSSVVASAKSREILGKLELIAVHGHPRPSILVPIDSIYATSY